MRPLLLIVIAMLLALGTDTSTSSSGQHPNFLSQIGTIPLRGVEGRIDHFAFDSMRRRLFVAGLGSDTVEVVDLHLGKVTQQIKHLRAPQGIGFDSRSDRLAVANDGDGSVRLYDGSSLQQTARIDLNDDADNVRYDGACHRFWVGYGEGGLAAIDPERGKEVADVKLGSHPESFQLEKAGNRIFVNLPKAGYVAVIDRETGKTISKFTLREARGNFPMALDEADQRLFIGCRSPAKLLVMDTKTGKMVAALDIVGDTDDLFYDAADKQIYASGGEGQITVTKQRSADQYEVAGQVATARGARTSFFVPETNTLYVAVPRRDEHEAEIRVFKVSSAR